MSFLGTRVAPPRPPMNGALPRIGDFLTTPVQECLTCEE